MLMVAVQQTVTSPVGEDVFERVQHMLACLGRTSSLLCRVDAICAAPHIATSVVQHQHEELEAALLRLSPALPSSLRLGSVCIRRCCRSSCLGI